jgi:hypothetical protein
MPAKELSWQPQNLKFHHQRSPTVDELPPVSLETMTVVGVCSFSCWESHR